MSFEYEQFIKTIQHKADLSWEGVERAAAATLRTLGERLSTGEARDIARQLPGDLGEALRTDTDASAFDAAAFVRRVADREGVDLDTAERHIRAVFVALVRTLSEKELEDMVAELPQSYSARFPAIVG